MASSLSFFSSPPHPTSNPWPRSANLFFTPQQQTSKHSWTTTGTTNTASLFAPPSPSPLRTSRNANLMSSPLAGGYESGKSVVDEEDDENTVMELPLLRQDQQSVTETDVSNPLSLFSSATTATTAPMTIAAASPMFSFGTNSNFTTSGTTADEQGTSNRDRAVQFQFSARARSSSPSVLLQSHAKETRDERKRLFLDRLRNKRDDARSDRAGDQVLRMDFMRERRRWEDEKARWGGTVDDAVDVDADVDIDVDLSEESGQMSPTEEKEIEELANEYYHSLQQQDMHAGASATNNNEAVNFGMEDFSDDGYDEVFMQMASQEPRIPQHEQVNNLELVAESRRSHPALGGGDLEMDMS